MPSLTKTLALLGALFLSGTADAAAAQVNDDEPIPYTDEIPKATRRPKTDPDEVPITHLKQSDREVKDRARSLASLDDPNTGLAFELLGGLYLLESSRGAGVEPRFADGARFTWEIGRVLRDVSLREALLLDFSYVYLGKRDGTSQVFVDSNLHDFTFAPAWAFPLGEGSPVALYLQLGGGVTYQFSSLHLEGSESRIAGVKPLLQYGLGLRGRPALNLTGSVRLSFRIEVTRFRRAYMDDTLFAASLGLSF